MFGLYHINRLVFITETESVYCAVRTGSLNKTVYLSFLEWSSNRIFVFITVKDVFSLNICCINIYKEPT